MAGGDKIKDHSHPGSGRGSGAKSGKISIDSQARPGKRYNGTVH
jgi:hypothetical protein